MTHPQNTQLASTSRHPTCHSGESAGSSLLLAAAIAGLLGSGAAGCGRHHHNDDSHAELPLTAATTTPQPRVISTTNAPDLTLTSFSDDCQKRGGLVQTHVSCSGTGSCKGLSYNRYSHALTEHTCRGANSCSGMSCVDLPADQHLAGDAIFAKNCAHCHTVKANGSADNSKFKLFLAPGSDQVKAVAQFAQTAALAHVSLVAFGTHGVNTNGTAFSNMPAFYETLSRPDIERVVTYVHTLTPVPKVYDVFGETQP